MYNFFFLKFGLLFVYIKLLDFENKD